MSIAFQYKLFEDGLVSTNVERLHQALDRLHDALSRMDEGQLRVFTQTEYGHHAAELADFYGRLEPFLRHDFTERGHAEPETRVGGATTLR